MKKCRICILIRYFLVCILLIIFIGLTMKDKLHYLGFINPWNAVKMILFLGFCVLIYKIIESKKNN